MCIDFQGNQHHTFDLHFFTCLNKMFVREQISWFEEKTNTIKWLYGREGNGCAELGRTLSSTLYGRICKKHRHLGSP